MTKNISEQIAAFAAQTAWADIPADVRHEAKRSLLNYFATAIAGSNEIGMKKSLSVLAPFAATGACKIIGRAEQVDMAFAAYLNGVSANIYDFDDTHQETVIHPTAPIAPAVFAHAEVRPCDGKALLKAFIIGGEIECRIGNAVSPSHYARGWHITATCGVFGASAAIAGMLDLSEEQHVWALGNAAAYTSGLVENLGTMSKSISVGNAARNGILSALLAQAGFSGPTDPLGGVRGFLNVYSDLPSLNRMTDGLGEVWEIAKNTYKPYPGGIVMHPMIEGCLRLYNEAGLRAEDVVEVELTGHPLLRERTDRPDVTTGRLSQISAQHTIAIALRRGKAGLTEFNDDAVGETLRDGIRPKVRFIDDDSRDIANVHMRVLTRQGPAHEIEITAAKGGPDNPMTDRELEDKLAELAEFRGFKRDVQAIADAVWALDTAEDASAVMRLTNLPS
ncbi:MAG: MmgE/PrpD family protein [Rhodospirillaceae bacterium]|nr:MmgE/PrpD family protein [Rhodospirillaceae bacterium]MBT4046133.1 MmgE/PrpD family protein [Rhodospirillaceae bacterium]MBT4689430.1 MmgE/PrpD family protein [Rhodospirillaceae bacterium]MBT5079150.1 MmgE/PrpD family protein [Rhodospirillaceae bacterium]MBT5527484.1 MmgE/PrpD family protein [Rhodospirillaceae bacterium]